MRTSIIALIGYHPSLPRNALLRDTQALTLVCRVRLAAWRITGLLAPGEAIVVRLPRRALAHGVPQ